MRKKCVWNGAFLCVGYNFVIKPYRGTVHVNGKEKKLNLHKHCHPSDTEGNICGGVGFFCCNLENKSHFSAKNSETLYFFNPYVHLTV